MTYVFDLDNTLCTTDGQHYASARPRMDRIAVVNRLYDEGHTIIIDSARGYVTKKPWRWMTKRQLKAWGVKYHGLHVGTKPAGDLYVDDRGANAVLFFGQYWPCEN